MSITTIFNYIADDWKRVKNHCRTTDNKEFTDVDATERFKKTLRSPLHRKIWSGGCRIPLRKRCVGLLSRM